MTTAEALAIIESGSGAIDSDIITDLISDDAFRNTEIAGYYDRYKGNVPILQRAEITGKPNSKLVNDYRAEIVDQKAGYSFGQPISYSIQDAEYTEKERTRNDVEFERFISQNNLKHLDRRTGKMMGICGTSSRLIYLDLEKKPTVMHVDPWETIFIYDRSIDELQYALRYYTVTVIEGGEAVERQRVEWYTSQTVTYYIETDNGYVLDKTESQNPYVHGFKKVPLIEFRNNDERIGDFERVETLIDAYDKLMSYNHDEIEAFRMAYLKLTGVSINAETLEQMRAMGAISLPEGSDADYITKQINDTFHENHKKTLDENIYRFAKAVNMSDEKFSGSGQSGESRKWKLKSVGDDAVMKEGMFENAVRQMFRCIQTYWNITGITIQSEDIKLKFTNNLPLDLSYHAEATKNLKGMISEETRLSLLPFVDNTQQEIERMAADQGGSISLDDNGDTTVV